MIERTKRLNSLLREVISEVIHREVRNPSISKLITVTAVDVSKDLRNATVYISVIGSEEERKNTIKSLKVASGFISINAAKKVIMRTFPSLTFQLDTSVDKQIQIESILRHIHNTKGKKSV